MSWGGVLLGGPAARLGPAASAYLWQLDSRAPDPVDVFTPRNVKAHTPWRFVRETPGARSGAATGSPPRLTAADTVVDRAATLRSEGEVVNLLTASLRMRMTRDNLHALRDATTLRYGWWHVFDHPCQVAYQVYVALQMRGYSGLFGRCRRCIGIPADCLSDLAG